MDEGNGWMEGDEGEWVKYTTSMATVISSSAVESLCKRNPGVLMSREVLLPSSESKADSVAMPFPFGLSQLVLPS